ncbi:MAG TPA: lantibiotic dehydratase, partial [Dyadobacter sp.]|nr:lantibiotic dehydratase [Dyadobacter sp.]
MKLEPDDFVIFRRSLLPFETLTAFHNNVQKDPESFPAYLREFFSDSLLKQGLEISSPAFYQQCLSFLSGQSSSDDSKVTTTLYKFLIRMCSRATPFGLFAGYFLSDLKNTTDITFDKDSPISLHNQLDSKVLQLLMDTILSDSFTRSKLSLQTNSSVYKVAVSVRFITTTSKQPAQFNLSQAESNSILESVLDLCQDGALFSEIITHLKQLGISSTLAKSYLKTLIDAQLLVFAIQRNAIGANYLDYLCNHHVLKRTKYYKHLTKLQSCLPGLQTANIRATLQIISQPKTLPSQLVHTTSRFVTKQSQVK